MQGSLVSVKDGGGRGTGRRMGWQGAELRVQRVQGGGVRGGRMEREGDGVLGVVREQGREWEAQRRQGLGLGLGGGVGILDGGVGLGLLLLL